MGIAFRAGVAVIPMAGGVQLRIGDDEVHVVRTDAVEVVHHILQAFDGRRDREGVLAEVGKDLAEVVDRLLEDLARAGLLQTDGDVDPRSTLAGARVGVAGHSAGAARLLDVLVEHGLSAHLASAGDPKAKRFDVMVGLVEQPDLSRLLALNAAAIAGSVPTLFVDASHGRHATVGPFFIPGEGACLGCFRARLRENTAAFDELLATERLMLERGEPLAGVPLSPAHRHLVVGIAAAEVVTFFTRDRPLRTMNRAITVSFDELRTWSEPVWRVPWCPACGATRPT